MAEKLESVTYCKYLGIVFSSRLVWSKARETLAIQAKKASFPILELFRKFQSLPLTTALKIFDNKIAPILLYGSEIWGYEYCESFEKIQCYYLKKYLRVGKNVSNTCNAILGEVGRTYMCVSYFTRVIKYWCRLLHMNVFRYPKACYLMLKSHDENGTINWVSNVRSLLFQTGFSYVWISQNCGDMNAF